jgi:hypothetical protein
MSLEDVAFYLPALGSFALLGISVTLGVVAVRAFRAWRAKRAVEKSPKT